MILFFHFFSTSLIFLGRGKRQFPSIRSLIFSPGCNENEVGSEAFRASFYPRKENIALVEKLLMRVNDSPMKKSNNCAIFLSSESSKQRKDFFDAGVARSEF
ncbi:hypothetical protein TNIN_89301 [Trichonephila inaurata madagascariensis]|uniref:Uncharacterized protein n=1 Tax=Trichonephila inaurata madagascariensis TaxID=2747483 RepID=A0A8X7BQE7_9ARAC|nr:hypothetical protein TNIN_118791 [Trichonephila inaurata madagascariensis]GFY73787.1 hypothetical protein TNIN_89301 [Trichonephila inaurata madagascariensis]